MGLWDDAQQQNRTDEANRDATTAEAQRQQSEINEYIAAMKKLGAAPTTFPLYYTSSDPIMHHKIKRSSVSGWPIAEYTQKNYYNQGSVYCVATVDGRLIDTGGQRQPRGGMFGPAFEPEYIALPIGELRLGLSLNFGALGSVLRSALAAKLG